MAPVAANIAGRFFRKGGPYRSSAGNYYVLTGEAGATSSILHVAKASALQGTYAEADSADRPTVSNSSGYLDVAADQHGDTICIAFHTSTSIHYVEFDMATDQWGTVTNLQTGLTVSASGPGGPWIFGIDIAVRSNGDVLVAYMGQNVVPMASYSRVKAAKRLGGTWTTAIDLDGLGTTATNALGASVVVDGSDNAHFFWGLYGNTGSRWRTLSAADVMGAVVTGPTGWSQTGAYHSTVGEGGVVNGASVVRVLWPVTVSSSKSLQWPAGTDLSATPGGGATISAGTGRANQTGSSSIVVKPNASPYMAFEIDGIGGQHWVYKDINGDIRRLSTTADTDTWTDNGLYYDSSGSAPTSSADGTSVWGLTANVIGSGSEAINLCIAFTENDVNYVGDPVQIRAATGPAAVTVTAAQTLALPGSGAVASVKAQAAAAQALTLPASSATASVTAQAGITASAAQTVGLPASSATASAKVAASAAQSLALPVTAASATVTSGSAPTVTWNPSDKGTGITLSGNDLTALNTLTAGGWQERHVRATTALTGKKFWRVRQDVASVVMGIAPASQALTGSPAAGAWGVSPGNQAVYNGPTWVQDLKYTANGATDTPGNGDWVNFAFDADTNTLWVGKGTQWYFGTSAASDPATGAGGYAVGAGVYYPWIDLQNDIGQSQATAAFADDGSGLLPSGFSWLDGGAAPVTITATAAQALALPASSAAATVAWTTVAANVVQAVALPASTATASATWTTRAATAAQAVAPPSSVAAVTTNWQTRGASAAQTLVLPASTATASVKASASAVQAVSLPSGSAVASTTVSASTGLQTVSLPASSATGTVSDFGHAVATAEQALTLPSSGASAASSVAASASHGIALPASSVVASTTVRGTAVAAEALPVSQATASASVRATSAGQLALPASTATATVSEIGHITATANQALALPGSSAAASITARATAGQAVGLPVTSATAAAKLTAAAAQAVALPASTATATVSAAPSVQASAAQVLALPVSSAAAASAITAASDRVLALPVTTATATATWVRAQASAAQTLSLPASTAEAATTVRASAAQAVAQPVTTATATRGDLPHTTASAAQNVALPVSRATAAVHDFEFTPVTARVATVVRLPLSQAAATPLVRAQTALVIPLPLSVARGRNGGVEPDPNALVLLDAVVSDTLDLVATVREPQPDGPVESETDLTAATGDATVLDAVVDDEWEAA